MNDETTIIDFLNNTCIPISVVIALFRDKEMRPDEALEALSVFIQRINEEGAVLRAIRRSVTGERYEDNHFELVELSVDGEGLLQIRSYMEAVLH